MRCIPAWLRWYPACDARLARRRRRRCEATYGARWHWRTAGTVCGGTSRPRGKPPMPRCAWFCWAAGGCWASCLIRRSYLVSWEAATHVGALLHAEARCCLQVMLKQQEVIATGLRRLEEVQSQLQARATRAAHADPGGLRAYEQAAAAARDAGRVAEREALIDSLRESLLQLAGTRSACSPHHAQLNSRVRGDACTSQSAVHAGSIDAYFMLAEGVRVLGHASSCNVPAGRASRSRHCSTKRACSSCRRA